MENKFVGINMPAYLNKWCEEQGIEMFGRKNSKSDFIRATLMNEYKKQNKDKSTD